MSVTCEEQLNTGNVPLASLSDAGLLSLVRQGNEEAEEVFYGRYKAVVLGKARRFYLVGGDRDDLIQEGMLGLYRAVCEYRADRDASFATFADLCIRRQMLMAIQRANRQKHLPLNASISLSEGEEGKELENVLPGGEDPEETLLRSEQMAMLKEQIRSRLTELEKNTLALYLRGLSYREIGEKLGKNALSVDNTIRRVKRKLERRKND